MGLRLFNMRRGMTKAMLRPGDVETDAPALAEAHMEIMIGVRFPTSS